MANKGYTSQQGTVDIRAPAGHFKWAGACASAGPLTEPFGAVTSSKCRDPQSTLGFRIFNRFRAAPDDPSMDLLLPKWKASELDRRLRLCPHDVRKRWYDCLVPENLHSWALIEDLRNVMFEQKVDSVGTIEVGGTGADVIETYSMKGACLDLVWRVIPARIGVGITTLPINAVRFCSAASCGECGQLSDGCTVFKAVTDSGPSYLDAPQLIIATRDLDSWAWAYVVRPITPWSAGGEHALDLACLIDGRVIAVSNVAGALAYTDNDGVAWTNIPLVAGGEPNAIYALDWGHIYVAADGGYSYVSLDGGSTWSTIAPNATVQNLLDVHAYGSVVVMVGANNAVQVSTDEGQTYDVRVGPAAGVQLNTVQLFSENEVLVGTNDGRVFRSTDLGETWDEVVDFADVLGEAAQVRAWDFCGCLADKGFVLVNTVAGPVGHIYRTIDHAMEFEPLLDNSMNAQDLPLNAGVNGIACCDPNVAVVVGEVQAGSGYMSIVK